MKVLFAGDFCPRNRVAKLIEEAKYQSVLSEVQYLTQAAVYSIVNLECPVVEHEVTPIDKCGPNLKCSSKAITALKWAGFDAVTLANNHFLDYGDNGVTETLNALDKQGIGRMGGGKNLDEASRIFYIQVEGKKLAIINCCEHEFSIATGSSGGSNPLNIVRQYYAIREARRNADYVVVIVHGGVELFWLPSKRMIETYRFFIDAGADAVVNHHQHCYSGYEVYNGKPIFYGLGNFCFDKPNSDYRWTSGYMVEIDFKDSSNIDFSIIPYRQCAEEACVRILKGEEKQHLLDTVLEYNRIIADEKRLESEYMAWCRKKQGMYTNALNHGNNRFTAWLFKGNLGKRIINKRRLLQTFDYLINESHIERMRLLIEDEIKKR